LSGVCPVEILIWIPLTFSVTCSGFQTGLQWFRRKSIAKVVSDIEHVKIHLYMSVLKLPLLVDLQQKVDELVISITYYPSVIIL
jgi:hypothetical protein